MANSGFSFTIADAAILSLLLLGHALGEFVFRGQSQAERTGASFRALCNHALRLTFFQAVVILPFSWSWASLGLVLLIGLSHLGVDRLTVWLDGFRTHPLGWYALDQALHLAMLTLVWWLWPGSTPPLLPVSGDWFEPVGQIALTMAVFAFNTGGGARLVAGLLERFPVAKSAGNDQGRIIGILERLTVLTLVLWQAWGAIGFVMVAKSIARFKKLEDPDFAERYLIGTLSSILVALLSGLAILACVAAWPGID